MRNISIRTLDAVSLDEADLYLLDSNGDEIAAAYELACDRNLLDGSSEPPDEAEVHHALFLLRRARGQAAPSFDTTRLAIRRRAAA